MSDHSDERTTTFRVTRTSVWDDDVQPCPEAYRGTYTQHVYCTFPLDKAMQDPHTDWFRRLTNHRKAPGGSVADCLDVPCWFVKMDGLRDLQEFVTRYGRVIVAWESDGPSIEIYDGYRE